MKKKTKFQENEGSTQTNLILVVMVHWNEETLKKSYTSCMASQRDPAHAKTDIQVHVKYRVLSPVHMR